MSSLCLDHAPVRCEHLCETEARTTMETKIIWLKLGRAIVASVLVILLFTPNCSSTRRNRNKRPKVEISNGKIKGVVSQSREGRNYNEFLGIPYAKPPVGELRFESPEPAERWDNTLDASRYKSECIQMDIIVSGRSEGSEDCLYLNVFTPNLKPKLLMPVLVFIHGGFFMSGSADIYRAKYFMDKDVVLVTLNYRLGALGFLTTGDGFIRGNMGLRDQIQALQWVQRNIDKFGGNPNSVTLFGESAGGASVNYLMYSPLAKGLFHKGISQSGTGTRKYLLTDDQTLQAQHFATQMKCPFSNSSEMMDCLKKADAETIVKVHREAVKPERNKFSLFGPVVEHLKDSKAVLIENPIDTLKSGNFNRMPWMVGVNSGEGLMYVAQILRDRLLLTKFDDDWALLFPKLLRLNVNDTNLTQKIRQYYFGNARLLNIQENIQNFTNMFSDRFFYQPTKLAAGLHAKYAPAYLYYFSHRTPVTVFDLVKSTTPSGRHPPEVEFAHYITKRWFREKLNKDPERTFYGACHADELIMLFNANRFSEIKRKSIRHYTLSRAMIKLWTDFATDHSKLVFQGVPWKAMNPADPVPSYLEIRRFGRIIREPFAERVKFWESLNIVD